MSPSATQNPVEASIPDPSAMGASVHSRAQPEQVESLGKTKDGRALKISTYPIFLRSWKNVFIASNTLPQLFEFSQTGALTKASLATSPFVTLF